RLSVHLLGISSDSSSCACQYDAHSASLLSSCQRVGRQALPRTSLSHGTYCLSGTFLRRNPHIEAWKIKSLPSATCNRVFPCFRKAFAGIDLALLPIRVAIRHEERGPVRLGVGWKREWPPETLCPRS